MRQTLLILFAFVLSSMGAWAADGATFKASVPNDDSTVDMTFKIISEDAKTCQVGDGLKWCLPTVVYGGMDEYYYDEYSTTTGTVTIPATVTYNDAEYSVVAIGDFAFDGWRTNPYDRDNTLSGLILPEGLQTIGQSFDYCLGITALTIPSTVTSIDEKAFDEMEKLNTLSVADGNSVYDSREGCNAIIETATNTLVHGGNSSVIPASVTKIGNYAFQCRNIRNINLKNVTSIGEYAFFRCHHLDRVVIPDAVTEIKPYAFSGCYSLKSVYLPTTVTTIGESAFAESGMKDYFCFRSLVIPNSVTIIGEYNQEIKGETNVEIIPVSA